MHKHLFDEITKHALIQMQNFKACMACTHTDSNSISDESALEVVNGQENPENLIRSDAFKVLEVILRRGRPRNTERSYFHHQPLQAQETSSSAGRLPSSIRHHQVISDIPAAPIASLENSVTPQTAQTAYIAPTAPNAPSAPVIKRAGRRRHHADYSEAELAEWEIKKKKKSCCFKHYRCIRLGFFLLNILLCNPNTPNPLGIVN
jgi:hypothetical protein